MKPTVPTLLLVAILGGCGGRPETPPPDATEPTLEMPADPPGLTGWTPEGEERTFDASNLWDAINGAADLYLAYGFVELSMRDYRREGVRVTVERYDQGAPINAFGVFRRERPAGAEAIPAGAEAAIVAPYDCLMIQGRHYLRAKAVEGELDGAHCAGLLGELGAALPGEAALPAELELLPDENRVAGSEGYTRKSYLGTADLNDCLFARYSGGGGEHQLFAVLGDPDARWSTLAGKWKEAKVGNLPGLSKEIPYQGAVVIARTAEGILGISGPKDPAAATALLAETIASR